MSITPQEAQAITEIRANMEPMLELARKRKQYSDELVKEVIKNGKSTLVEIIEERRQAIYEQYETMRLEVIMQIGRQGNYISERNLSHSTAWHDLLEDLKYYTFSVSLLELNL